MSKALNFYKSMMNGEVISIWESKDDYENHDYTFDNEWKQVGSDGQ